MIKSSESITRHTPTSSTVSELVVRVARILALAKSLGLRKSEEVFLGREVCVGEISNIKRCGRLSREG